MGFGILFVGYLLLFICRGVDIFPDVIAYSLMLYAMSKLAAYNGGFKSAKTVLAAALPVAVISDALQIAAAVKTAAASAVAGTSSAGATIADALIADAVIADAVNATAAPLPVWLTAAGTAAAAVMAVMITVFHYFLFRGVRTLALEVRLPKIADGASGRWALTVVYFAASLVMLIDVPQLDEFRQYLGLPLFVFGLVWVSLNASLIFSCYMRICLEGDEDMPEDYSSGFGLKKKANEKNANNGDKNANNGDKIANNSEKIAKNGEKTATDNKNTAMKGKTPPPSPKKPKNKKK